MQTDLREARGRLTLQALAERSGVDASTISRLERGKQSPNYSTARALEIALGRKPGTLSFPKLISTRSDAHASSVSTTEAV